MSQLAFAPTMPDGRTGWAGHDPSPILIQVPEVEAWRIPGARRHPGTSARSHHGPAVPRRALARPPRRRLRREVRVAGRVFLVLAPLVAAAVPSPGQANRNPQGIDRSVAVAVAVERTRDRIDPPGAAGLGPSPADGRSIGGDPGTLPEVLSIESVAGTPADGEVPIVFPGYVLPDDSLEEPAHGGS
ncbi:MAG TPA: hypothetical protein VFF52_15430 [Isosphaeraceae bacterium]|nr:hypothetical protein [Isosphaeraceae bacterium]